MADPVVDRSDRNPPELAPLREAVSTHPRERSPRLRLAWGLIARNDYDAAWDVLDDARRQFPGDADILYGLGLVAIHLKRPEEADEAFSQVEDLADHQDDPGRSEILKRLAMGHRNRLRTGHWDLSETIWGMG
jgi:Flp pilus assembly protein TadD